MMRSSRFYDPAATEPFRVSRSKIDLFIQCPHCFYLDRRLGIARPSMPAFTLNNAVDTLLKKEFDIHRAAGTKHPLMEHYGIDAVPLAHEKMDEWRDSLRRGVAFLDEATNFMVTGGVDDIWKNPAGELIVVDYKATSSPNAVTLEGKWKEAYKRQMEVYQWLLRRNGFTVSPTGYFVYCNGRADRKAFDAKLEFDVTVLPYTGDDGWVAGTLRAMKVCLDADDPPIANEGCEHCTYRAEAARHEG
ncbi:MAG TPA: PD-(D/E)XK nuclease family protein [Candidatus Paceibacterota bacterium]|nr:PD-(D/E)XK nuclease family protein [Candidatus Paceibacterota bacterium]